MRSQLTPFSGTGVVSIQVNSAKDILPGAAGRLLERAQGLDAQALAQLHDRYYLAVYRYVHYRLEDEQLVEDISSEVFLRLLDHFHRRKGEIHDLRAWLLGTASNLINEHLRQKYRRRTETLADFEILSSDEDVHRAAEQSDNLQAVRQAMLRLTREQQHVLALRFSQDLSIEETARLMNKTSGAVKVLQFRALAAIRKIINRIEGEE